MTLPKKFNNNIIYENINALGFLALQKVDFQFLFFTHRVEKCLEREEK